MEVFLIKALQLILSLSILVILHELGHFVPARLFGTRVEKFYLFFDWPFSIFKKKIGDTEYGVGALPLGGYVKISGMVDESFDTENLKNEDLLISKSSDSGTPLICGSVKFSDFSYGVESFKSHIENLKRLKINYKQIFNRELTFEIDTPDDYTNFLLHKPRWYRKLS